MCETFEQSSRVVSEYFRIKRNASVKENMEKQKHQVSGNLMTKV